MREKVLIYLMFIKIYTVYILSCKVRVDIHFNTVQYNITFLIMIYLLKEVNISIIMIDSIS